ncbi:D-alanyl-D-alanine carboxypeptidase/D-alanyl-D-alanine endopeptidase [Marininema halotolerans]|uniref:D-alanyl-D-alanine carboxypeptidase, serine-type, PBP4 family n=1 Tax=Marininema halotolerans TaxID=1155944 RepID=A0A1I6R2F5_9BACL|nr:D-alanyl-D-alanine carboxypeptidase/D-alanyl-D-alanine-endopeptidase [Marininema halotolerans]SFS58901.1 D-alanyl-D-alanine carboxypeptidase, serine-type, PBP4 family [Marininema halotolerans]
MWVRWRWWCTLGVIAGLIGGLFPVPMTSIAADAPDQRLEQRLLTFAKGIESRSQGAGMSIAYQVVSLQDHRVLASYRKEKTLVPGPVSRLWTASASYHTWSTTHQFATELYTRGKIRGGILHGDVIVKGGGDPSLDVAEVDKLARALKEKGIQRVTGNLVVDDTRFDPTKLGISWMWDQESFPAHAPIGALDLHGNTIEVAIKPGSIGEKPHVSISPKLSDVTFSNQATTSLGSSNAIEVDRTRAKNEYVVSGKIGHSHPPVQLRRTVNDPSLYTGEVFQQRMKKVGIRFAPHSRVMQGIAPSGNPLLTQKSLPLKTLVSKMKEVEHSLIGEVLLRQLAVEAGEEGSDTKGLEVLRHYATHTVGVKDTFRPKDGSGLSRMSVMSPEQLTDLMQWVSHDPSQKELTTLFTSVGEGALKGRMEGTRADENLRAFPVDEPGISGLTGIVKSRTGEPLAFSIMINGVSRQQVADDLEDRMGITLASYPEIPEVKAVNDTEKYPLSALLDPLVNREGYEGIQTGMVVRSLDSGETMYRHEGSTHQTPASNTKLLTSSAAFDALGPDYQFRTELVVDGKITHGTLHGDLILKGYGDPTLASESSLKVQEGPTIEGIVKDIKKRGIKRIHGNIAVDSTAFSNEIYGKGWASDNENEYYQPQITALSVNRGTVRFDYLPGDKVGDPIRWSLTPQTKNVQVKVDVTTGEAGSKNTLKIERKRGTNRIHLSGSLPLDFKGDYTRVPVERPHCYTGVLLKEALIREGINVTDTRAVTEKRVPQKTDPWAVYYSPPLSEVARYLNKASDNFYAEMILRTLGLEKHGIGSAENGLAVVKDYLWRIHYPGTFQIEDGSGLTRYNFVSPEQLVFLLAAQRKTAQFEAFYQSLPLAGKDGSLANRMKNTPAANNLRGKTGSLTHVSTLSGYVQTQDHEWFAYSIMMNGYTPQSETSLQDQIGAALAGYSRQKKTTPNDKEGDRF